VPEAMTEENPSLIRDDSPLPEAVVLYPEVLVVRPELILAFGKRRAIGRRYRANR